MDFNCSKIYLITQCTEVNSCTYIADGTTSIGIIDFMVDVMQKARKIVHWWIKQGNKHYLPISPERGPLVILHVPPSNYCYHYGHCCRTKFKWILPLNITYPLEIPPPAEKPPLGRSTRFITKSTLRGSNSK